MIEKLILIFLTLLFYNQFLSVCLSFSNLNDISKIDLTLKLQTLSLLFVAGIIIVGLVDFFYIKN